MEVCLVRHGESLQGRQWITWQDTPRNRLPPAKPGYRRGADPAGRPTEPGGGPARFLAGLRLGAVKGRPQAEAQGRSPEQAGGEDLLIG